MTLLAPADGTYSLASSDAPLVLTVRNDLPFAVQVLLDLQAARQPRAVDRRHRRRRRSPPGQRTTLQVPTQVRQSGGFAVTAALTTPGGGPLGDRVELQVKSTAYGSISLLITIGAAGAARPAVPAPAGAASCCAVARPRRRRPAAPEGAAVPQPPTRSPV